jgi:hypothetical protein
MYSQIDYLNNSEPEEVISADISLDMNLEVPKVSAIYISTKTNQ